MIIRPYQWDGWHTETDWFTEAQNCWTTSAQNCALTFVSFRAFSGSQKKRKNSHLVRRNSFKSKENKLFSPFKCQKAILVLTALWIWLSLRRSRLRPERLFLLDAQQRTTLQPAVHKNRRIPHQETTLWYVATVAALWMHVLWHHGRDQGTEKTGIMFHAKEEYLWKLAEQILLLVPEPFPTKTFALDKPQTTHYLRNLNCFFVSSWSCVYVQWTSSVLESRKLIKELYRFSWSVIRKTRRRRRLIPSSSAEHFVQGQVTKAWQTDLPCFVLTVEKRLCISCK